MFPRTSESPAKILVVDDEPAMLRYLQNLLEGEGHQVEMATSGLDALRRVNSGLYPDLVLLDLLMPGIDGLQTLQQMREINAALNVVILSCVTDSRKVVQAIRLGATDYVTKPFLKKDLHNALQPSLKARSRRPPPCGEMVEDIGGGGFFITASAEMHKLRAQAELVAQVDIPVLLLGESGTGKEVFARIIHHVSPRAQGPFLKVNCAAVPADLLESELFGYEPGAFTGANQSKPGKFELCHKGTILLDEIGEMTPALQAKLLHVLQDQEFSRLGGRTIIKADVRIVAATNIDVSKAIANKKLREDLYYRLSGFTLHLPPLRERKADIGLLLRHLMCSLAERFACQPLPISQDVLEACNKYSWPGNIRELENFVKRSLVLQEFTSPASHRDMQHPYSQGGSGASSGAIGGLKSLARCAREEAEVEIILSALQQTNWNRKRAAEQLKISYKALLYKIREYDIASVIEPVA